MTHGGKREAGPGKKIGRPAKPKIELTASKGIATDVLAMDGKPDHIRKCKCRVCKGPKACECREQCGHCGKGKKDCKCEEGYAAIKVKCGYCWILEEHRVCHCEQCGWWELMLDKDRRVRLDSRKYLTDRRDGKPAQGVFIGDTRETARELDFGDLPELITPGQSVAPRRPN